MTYTAVLRRSDEGGYSVSVPGLPGCWSQGGTRAEAINNIKDAVREYLSVARELATESLAEGAELHDIELTL